MPKKKKEQAKKDEVPIKIPKKVEGFLEKNNIKCEVMGHRTVYTAFDKAATLKMKPAQIAKVLVVKIDGTLAMAVVGGNRNLDMGKLLKLSRPKGEARQMAARPRRGSLETTKKINFAKEKSISETFKGIDPGAIPPFSGLWKVPVFCDKKFLEQSKIILSAGSYEASLAITPAAFKKANLEMIFGIFSIAKQKSKLKNKPRRKQ